MRKKSDKKGKPQFQCFAIMVDYLKGLSAYEAERFNRKGDKMVRRNTLFILVPALLLMFAGCESMGHHAKKGAVTGGVIGAATGGVIGHQKGRGLEGAAIGGVLGAIGGGLIGSAIDDTDRQALRANPEYLPITKIAEMGREGVPDSVIIEEIRRTRSTYSLNSEIIGYLQENNVSDNVIDYMLKTGK